MPELAEVKLYAENLHKIAEGKIIEDLRCYNGADFDDVKGRVIERVSSYGKGVYFEFRGGGNLYVHLMLTGGFRFVGKEDYAAVTGKLLSLKFCGGYLIVRDENRYAKIERDRARPNVPEAGGAGFTPNYLKEITRSRASVKNVLTNQSLVAGLGNAYADEILYAAGINPFSPANKLPESALHTLHAAVTDVLTEAEQYLRKRCPDVIEGEDRGFFKVHVKGQTHTQTGEKILVKTVGGRKTYYTDSQTLY